MVTCTTPPFRAAVRLNSGVSAYVCSKIDCPNERLALVSYRVMDVHGLRPVLELLGKQAAEYFTAWHWRALVHHWLLFQLANTAQGGEVRIPATRQKADTCHVFHRGLHLSGHRDHSDLVALTIRSSRARFAVSALALRLSQRRARSAGRLNSGVRRDEDHWLSGKTGHSYRIARMRYSFGRSETIRELLRRTPRLQGSSRCVRQPSLSGQKRHLQLQVSTESNAGSTKSGRYRSLRSEHAF